MNFRKDLEAPYYAVVFSSEPGPEREGYAEADQKTLELAMQMQDWSSAVIDHAKRIISDGGEVPGWTLKQGRKMRFWSAPAMVEEALRDVPEAWESKSVAAITKLNIDLPEGLIGEKISAPSLARSK